MLRDGAAEQQRKWELIEAEEKLHKVTTSVLLIMIRAARQAKALALSSWKQLLVEERMRARDQLQTRLQAQCRVEGILCRWLKTYYALGMSTWRGHVKAQIDHEHECESE